MQSTRPYSLSKVTSRFWSRVDRTKECWIFSGAKDQDGYGQFMHDYRNYRAHQFALLLNGVVVPHGMVTRHLCNNRACVRFDHLAVGTQAENIADAVSAGTLNPRRISSEVEESVREAYLPGATTLAEVAQSHGISKSQVHRIIRRAA